MSQDKPKALRLLPEARYHEDPLFRQIVDFMESLIHQGQLSPDDLRQAAVYAAIRYELCRKPRPFYVDAEGKLYAADEAPIFKDERDAKHRRYLIDYDYFTHLVSEQPFKDEPDGPSSRPGEDQKVP